VLHQQTANRLRGDLIGGATEEGYGEVLGELGGYGSGFCEEVLRDTDRARMVG
jgi:hypothetical protein